MSGCVKFGTALFVLGVVLALVQMWFNPWTAELFLKMEMTLGGLFLIVVGVCFVRNEYSENKRTRSGDSLDD